MKVMVNGTPEMASPSAMLYCILSLIKGVSGQIETK